MSTYQKKKPTWVIIGISKIDGTMLGYTENSFSMGTNPNVVRVWRVTKYSSKEKMLPHLHQQAKDLNLRKKDFVWKVYRVGSKNCPVKINWKGFWRMYENGKTPDKFNWRNLGFVPR